jgi:hypothetical protein
VKQIYFVLNFKEISKLGSHAKPLKKIVKATYF